MAADSAGTTRRGEELDGAAVSAWLRANWPETARGQDPLLQEALAPQGLPEITQYSGGASNWTYRLQYPHHDLVLRRPPAGTKAKSAHDMGREFRIQQALKPVFPYVPGMIALCSDASVIGAEFYVMQRIEGIIPRKNLPRGVTLTREQTRKLCLAVLDALVALHRVDYRAAGLESIGKGAGYTRRQVEGWSERYARARTWNVPGGKGIVRWLQAHLPATERICVTHNDFRFDNVVLDPADPTRIVGVLDWELATLGDPLMDLGNLLAYWVEAGDDFMAQASRRQPTHLPGMLTRREVVDYYCSQMGIRAEHWAFYEVFGLFRLSAIAQQIYYRYHHGQTRNPAFKRFWLSVHYLHWRARRAMKGA